MWVDTSDPTVGGVIVAATVFELVMTVTAACSLATYTIPLDGLTATPNGAGSIGILVTKAFVNVFITATVSEGEF